MTTTANDKTVLVTGASRGIGAAIAKQLAGIGMNVIINYASDEGAANEVVRSITAAGGVAIAVKGDVSKSDQFAHLFDQAELRFGGLDMLVNNAGQMSPMPIADVDEEKFDRLFAINVRGVLNGCKLAAKRSGTASASSTSRPASSVCLLRDMVPTAPLKPLWRPSLVVFARRWASAASG